MSTSSLICDCLVLDQAPLARFEDAVAGWLDDRADNAPSANNSNAQRDLRGNVSGGESSVNPFEYLGSLDGCEDGDNDQIYVRTRCYAPTLGRFLPRDPSP